jgi:hypothetical protein
MTVIKRDASGAFVKPTREEACGGGTHCAETWKHSNGPKFEGVSFLRVSLNGHEKLRAEAQGQ